MTDSKDGIDWRLATWDGVARAQLRRWAQLSLKEIVEAQEAMQDLAERLAEAKDCLGARNP